MNIYQSYVFTDKLVSPVNGYCCKRITKQNINQFGFESKSKLLEQYPEFPLMCEKYKKCCEKASLAAVSTSKEKKKHKLISDMENYSHNLSSCVHCESILPFTKRNHKFCNQSCSASFNNKKRANPRYYYCLQCGIQTRNPKFCNISCSSSFNNSKRTRPHKSTYKPRTPKLTQPKVETFKDTTLLGVFKSGQMFRRKSPNLIKIGFDFNQPVDTEFYRIQELLFTEYHINKESMLSIMKKYSIPSTRTMDILFRLFDIDSRTLSEGSRLALLTERSSPSSKPHKIIYHPAWYGETVLLRSSYEERYAKELDLTKTMYTVEQLRIEYFCSINQNTRVAVPDFYLPDTNTIVEVKDTYWLNEQNMRDKKKAYLSLGYKFMLHLDNVLLDDW
jgi:hypothetical protein